MGLISSALRAIFYPKAKIGIGLKAEIEIGLSVIARSRSLLAMNRLGRRG